MRHAIHMVWKRTRCSPCIGMRISSFLCKASSSFYDKPLEVLVYKAADNEVDDFGSCREVIVRLIDA